MAARLFIVGKSKAVFRSEDNGVSWQLKNAGLPDLEYTSVGMQFDDRNHVAIGARRGEDQRPMILISLDGGDTWLNRQVNSLSSPFAASRVEAIQWVNENTIYAAVTCPNPLGNSHFLIKSINQGVSWTTLFSMEDDGYKVTCSFHDASEGYWGPYRITDAGATRTNMPGAIKRVQAQRGGDKAIGVYTGNSNTGVSEDRGATWDTNGNNGADVWYANSYARTSDGKYMGFYHRDNGSGSNFTFIIRRELVTGSLANEVSLTVGGSDRTMGGFFIDGDVGVFVTEDGRIYRTINGGNTFYKLAPILPGAAYVPLNAIDGENVLTSCAVQVTVDEVVNAVGGVGGQVTFTATGGTDGPTDYEFLIRVVGTADNVWTPIVTNPRTVISIAPGDYEVLVRDSEFHECQDAKTFTVGNVLNLLAQESHTNVTAAGQSDGTITINVTQGSGEYQIVFNDMPPPINASTATKINLPTGVYGVTVYDLITLQSVAFEIVITEPSLDPTPGGSYLVVPILNALHFVEKAEVNGCEVFPTPDNLLFCDQKAFFPGFTWKNYYQKVQKCDPLPIQFFSDYDEHLIELVDYITNEVMDTYIPEVKEQNTNIQEEFDIFITYHDVGKSRVYFQVGQLPLPLQTSDLFQVFNNADGFNGSYQIISIINDVLLGQQYLVINKVYGIPAPASTGKARFLVDNADFNVMEVNIHNIAAKPNGQYFVRISGTTGLARTWTSEPFDLQVEHEGTNLIEYRNFDNAFNVTWTTGITFRIRVESTLFDRMPKSDKDTWRNQDQSLNVLRAKMRRGFLFKTWLLTPYLHEKLAVIFCLDFFKINGVRYQADEDYDEPKYITRYPLSNSQIKIEQYGWFDKYNSDDLGPVVSEEAGFIIANNGFLRR